MAPACLSISSGVPGGLKVWTKQEGWILEGKSDDPLYSWLSHPEVPAKDVLYYASECVQGLLSIERDLINTQHRTQ